MRCLGLDIGTVRIGVALSDETGTIASPLTMLRAEQPFEQLSETVRELCEANDVELLVVGLPLSMSGAAGGKSARLARKLGKALGAALALDVRFADERFTTAVADRALIGANVDRRKRKTLVDKVAAAVMLQTFLDAGFHRET